MTIVYIFFVAYLIVMVVVSRIIRNRERDRLEDFFEEAVTIPEAYRSIEEVNNMWRGDRIPPS